MTYQFSASETDPVATSTVQRHAHVGSFFKNSSSGFYASCGKRVLDLTLTILVLPIVAPLLILMAAVIALDGRNPFYSQLRVGRGGKTFRMWKLRTMVHNADDLLESYIAQNPAARLEWDTTQKLKNDPRITWIGQILRKTSMDELPQLLNVLEGTMSLVGPRP
ncbi:MAG: sugar transferase, partial [Pseudomonadota bacterium]